MTVLDGRVVAQGLQDRLRGRIAALEHRRVTPTLAPILVGEDRATAVYYRSKQRLAKRLGIGYAGLHLPQATTQEELLAAIALLNADPQVHGVLLERPLPGSLSYAVAGRAIAPEKDVDGIHPLTMGRLLTEGAAADYAALTARTDLLIPATPQAVMELLRFAGVELEGREVVVVSHSVSVGRPLALLLLAENATVTVCHAWTRDLPAATRRAEILCVAAGRPGLVTAEMVAPGAVVIDVGITVTDEGIVGDVDHAEVSRKASLITPVPGGVGPVTTTLILANTVTAAEQQATS
jgi:methylenetetrahydrofolate dehydrogenase (NADP+) / methenyltetrahydrofolate cyclohydrolase